MTTITDEQPDPTYGLRADHLAWAKLRALELLDAGDEAGALTSMSTDLGKHPLTRAHAAIRIGFKLLAAGQLASPEEAREFIEGIA